VQKGPLLSAPLRRQLLQRVEGEAGGARSLAVVRALKKIDAEAARKAGLP